MFLVVLVVAQGLGVDELTEVLFGDGDLFALAFAIEDYHLEGVQGNPGVPVGELGNQVDGVGLTVHFQLGKGRGVSQGPFDDLL